MKARKSKANEIDRGHETLNNEQDCNRFDSEEGDEDQRKGSAKEESKLMECEFGKFYPKDWIPPEASEFYPL